MLSALPQATYEGDFVVLSIQVGTQLLGAVSITSFIRNLKLNSSTNNIASLSNLLTSF